MSGRFRFRLQSVLEQRSRVVDERQRELAATQRELADAQAIEAQLEGQRENERRALTAGHAGLDGDRLRAAYAHLGFLDRTIEEHAERVAACHAEVERAQRRLVAANTDRKVLETLKSRRYEAFCADAAQLEQRDVDDQNARRYARAQRTQQE